MVTIYQAYVVPIITGILIFGVITWMGYLLFFLLPKWSGLSNYRLVRRIKKKYKKGFNYDDETIKLCQIAITRGWKLKEMIFLTNHSPHRDEILYTFVMMMKIKKDWFDPKLYHETQTNVKFLEEMVKKVK